MRRLLIAGGGGGGGFTAPAQPAEFSLATTGFWSDLASPRAAYYNGKTYLIWITSAGDVKVGSYDHATNTMSSATTLHSGFSPADGTIHVAASIVVRSSDHKLVAVYAAQGAQPYCRISTNAEDETAWGTENAIMTSVALYTYSFLAEWTGGTLVYLSRFYSSGDAIFKWSYATSTDGGATWGSQADILIPDATNASYLYALAYGTKLHIFTTDTNRTSGNPSSVYHCYLEGTTLYKSDGTSIAGPYPVAASAGTLVQNASGGSARCNGIAFDGSGNPAAILLINDSDASTTNTAKVATWNGSSWDLSTVAGQNGRVDSNNFVASAQIVKNDPTVVYLPVKVGSYFELQKYVKSAGTWSATSVTSGSSADNAMPETPLNADAGLAVVWGQGTYTDASTFTFTLHGYGT